MTESVRELLEIDLSPAQILAAWDLAAANAYLRHAVRQSKDYADGPQPKQKRRGRSR